MIREESIQIPFRYAAGETASRFLVALRDDQQILGARCGGCAKIICPARTICPLCGEKTAELSRVGPQGTLTAAAASADGTLFGLVRLDGADTALLHRLLSEAVQPGGRVRVRFATERRAHILDIDGFEELGQ